jgi:hypothetical protein
MIDSWSKHGAMTFSITTLSIMTQNINGSFVKMTLNINDNLHNNTLPLY